MPVVPQLADAGDLRNVELLGRLTFFCHRSLIFASCFCCLLIGAGINVETHPDDFKDAGVVYVFYGEAVPGRRLYLPVVVRN